jgi:DNA (cytosine-5)-methyltransferase 1
MNYYNEIDKNACAILRELIRSNVISEGEVDDRSIADVESGDLSGYKQCHFFAGVGLWSVAARMAGWMDDRELWTGSCPCQPFSTAGTKVGVNDARHLWSHFLRVIRARRPFVVVGEQVAGEAGYGWFDRVRFDLEGEDYASRCVDIPACAIDAPHQRSRLYWVALEMENADVRREGRMEFKGGAAARDDGEAVGGGYGGAAEFWADSEWVECYDGKLRRAKRGLRLLVDGVAGNHRLWHVAGNSIVPQLAAQVIASLMNGEENSRYDSKYFENKIGTIDSFF